MLFFHSPLVAVELLVLAALAALGTVGVLPVSLWVLFPVSLVEVLGVKVLPRGSRGMSRPDLATPIVEPLWLFGGVWAAIRVIISWS